MIRALVVFLCLGWLGWPTQITNVPADADLQAAINGAQTGDTLQLADAVYTCNCIDNKGLTIIGPATIKAAVPSEPTFYYPPKTPPATLKNLRITTGDGQAGTIIKYGTSGTDQDVFDEQPQGLTIESCDIYGQPTQDLQRGIAANGRNFKIVNSKVRDIHGVGYDTQAIEVWNGSGPFTITDNDLQAAGENVMFGGADPTIPNLIPSDITISRNHIWKPLSWKVGDPSYAGKHWSIKNLLELKIGRRVTIDGNVFENSWLDAQVGFGLLLKSVNQDGGCTWCVTEDVVITNNTVKNVDHGINLLDRDLNPAVPMSRVRIANNLIQARGMFFQMGKVDSVTLEHNTSQAGGTGNTMTLYGGSEPSGPSTNFIVRNNVMARTGYGIKGDGTGEGTAALNAFAPGYVFAGNVVVGADGNIYPSGNFYPTTLDGFTGKGTDGKDPGVDMVALLAAQGGTAAPTPTATPTPIATPTPSPTATPTPTPTATPVPSPTVTPSPTPTPVLPCGMEVPSSVSIPAYSSGVISVTLNAVVPQPLPFWVSAVSSSPGQVKVFPLKQEPMPGTSASVPFGVKVKGKAARIDFSSPCPGSPKSTYVMIQ